MATTYIYRTTGAGNRKTWTISFWLKRASSAVEYGPFSQWASTSTYSRFRFNPDVMGWNDVISSSSIMTFATDAKYRDPSAWYHMVLAVDTTQATDTNRMKFYVNGVLQTFSSQTYPTQDVDTNINTTGQTVGVGTDATLSYFDGCMSHVQFVDGSALAPTEFGETDSTSGIWKIKTGSYATPGNNGFHLKMEDSSNLDLDSSSNAHTFTTSGTLTATKDNPSNNFCTLNPINNYYGGATFSNGNLSIVTGSFPRASTTGTIGLTTGKWFWEVKPTALAGGGAMIGIISVQPTAGDQYVGMKANCYGKATDATNYSENGVTTTYGTTIAVDDIIGVALDLDNSKLYFSKGGVWMDDSSGTTGIPTSGATGTGAISITAVGSTIDKFYFPAISDRDDEITCTIDINFGNGYFGTTAVASTNADDAGIGSFEYDVPAGYYAICTKNIKAYG